MDAETLSRVQFALTASFHFIFPPLSMGLGLMLLVVSGAYLRTKDPKWRQLAFFWTKVYGLIFALGVATTSIYTAASQNVPVESRGAAFAYLSSAYLVALAASPMMAGFLGAFSMRAVFVADAAGLAVLAWVVRREMSDVTN